MSSSLDTVVSGSPSCLRAVCVAEACVEATSDIVLGLSLAVMVPHAVSALPLRTKTQHLSATRATKYELILLTQSNITILDAPH